MKKEKNDLTINKCFGKCFKWGHWRERLREKDGEMRKRETLKVNVNNWFVVSMNNISSGVSRARIIITH